MPDSKQTIAREVPTRGTYGISQVECAGSNEGVVLREKQLSMDGEEKQSMDGEEKHSLDGEEEDNDLLADAYLYITTSV